MNVKIDGPSFMDPQLPLERPTLPADFGVGSDVLVIPAESRNRHSQAIKGVVTSKARMWISIVCPEFRAVNRFRLDNQATSVDNLHWADKFRTPEQHAWDQAQGAAYTYLIEQGIRLDSTSLWHKNPVPLARAIYYFFGSNQDDAS